MNRGSTEGFESSSAGIPPTEGSIETAVSRFSFVRRVSADARWAMVFLVLAGRSSSTFLARATSSGRTRAVLACGVGSRDYPVSDRVVGRSYRPSARPRVGTRRWLVGGGRGCLHWQRATHNSQLLGSRRRRSINVVKLLRVQGGCLGIERRRKTW